MESASSSRKRLLQCAANSAKKRNLSAGAVDSVLRDLEAAKLLPVEAPKLSSLRSTCYRSRQQWIRRICVNAPLPDKSGNAADWLVADPLSLLEAAAERRDDLDDLLRRIAPPGSGQTDILLYCDEANAGDPLHPDPARKAWLFYIAFPAAGMHTLHAKSWLPVAVLQGRRTAQIRGGLAGALTALLRSWQSCFEGRSVRLPGRTQILALRLQGITGDEQGLSFLIGAKGAAGRRPCWHCCNLVSTQATERLEGEGHEAFVTLDCADASKFVLSGDDEIFAALDHMQGVAATRPKKVLAELEKSLGFRHEPDGALMQPELREIVKPTCTVWDTLQLVFY